MTIQQEIWNFIHQETGVTRKDIKTQFSDLDQKQVSNAISRLMEKSCVIRTDEGTYYTDKVMVTNEPASEPFEQLVDTLPTSRKPSRMDIVGHNCNEGLHYPGDVGDENHHVNHVESEQPLQIDQAEALQLALNESKRQIHFYSEELDRRNKNILKLVDENDRLNSLKDKMQDELEKLRNSKAYFEPAHDTLLKENLKLEADQKTKESLIQALNKENTDLLQRLNDLNDCIADLKRASANADSEASYTIKQLKDELMKRRFPISEEPTSPHEFIFGLMSELPFESSFVFTKGSVPYLNIHGTLIEVQQDQWQQIIKYINALAPYMIDEQTDNFVHFKAA